MVIGASKANGILGDVQGENDRGKNLIPTFKHEKWLFPCQYPTLYPLNNFERQKRINETGRHELIIIIIVLRSFEQNKQKFMFNKVHNIYIKFIYSSIKFI